MGVSTLLNIGSTSLNVFRAATEVASENIANVNTVGYSRQQVIFETSPPVNTNGFVIGTGVNIAAVERYYDALLQRQIVTAQTTLGYDTTKSSLMQQVEPLFNEVASDGLGTAISDYFSAWQDLTLNPAGAAERQTLLSRAQLLSDRFHYIDTSLNNTVQALNDSLTPLTGEINQTLSSIARLNDQIKIIELNGDNANETKDQRDQLIRELSKQIGITYTENSDGTTDINYADGGMALVSGVNAGSFSLTANVATGLYDVSVTPPAGVTTLVAPATGELGATIAMRDTIIPGYLGQLDVLATTLTSEVNTLHLQGSDLTGSSPPPAGPPTTVAFFDPAVTGAATFGINPALTSANQIAASSNPLLIGNNSNALQIAQLQKQKVMLGNSATFNTFCDILVSQIGLDVLSAKNIEEQDIAFSKQLTTLRDSSTSVSLDEELTNLLKYQRSYQASAKLVTTATEMMDTVLNLIR